MIKSFLVNAKKGFCTQMIELINDIVEIVITKVNITNLTP